MSNFLDYVDYSTLDIDQIKKLPVYKPRAGLEVSDSMGNACSGDPPGYPTYFLQAVYTTRGNTCRDVPYVITIDGVHYVVNSRTQSLHEFCRPLWKPLYIHHQRTVCWIRRTYRHFHHCYHREGGKMLIWPLGHTDYEHPRIDTRWKDEYIEAEQARVKAINDKIYAEALPFAIPQNHMAVRTIRKYYPDAPADMDLIENPGDTNPEGTWWEVLATCPSEEDCAKTQRWGNRHPFNDTWCQHCGRTYPKGHKE